MIKNYNYWLVFGISGSAELCCLNPEWVLALEAAHPVTVEM